ncbi:heparinase II/III family protein [Streptomyces sp. NPDC060194]|uniref:heparinase II/III domain-containing protein n=1 Tax=Streptomyces sp. NPDC060194 TaxID=3347069 RepID=UPI00365B55A6
MSEHSRSGPTRRHVLAMGAVTAASATALALAPGATAAAAPRRGTPRPRRAGEPRVLVTARHLPAVRANLTDPVIAPRYALLQKNAALDTDGTLPDGVYSLPVKSAVEANAFLYLVHREEAVGRRAVTQMRNFLATFRPFPHTASVTEVRRTGTTLFTAALVYDWCYELLGDDDRAAFVAAMKRLAENQGVGFPPDRLSSVTSHASENELQRDQLAAGIAVYDEDPEIFDLVSARIREEFVPARNFFYPTGRHHQGDSYQGVRFVPDMLATVLYDRMGSDAGYLDVQQEQMTDWIHQRRPDGQLMRSGDTYQSTYHALGKYWSDSPTVISLLLSTAHYRNRWHQDYLLSHIEHGHNVRTEEALFFCLFHDPSLPRKAASTLPLTRIGPHPLAGMTARTGWDEGPDADTSIAQVHIGGHNFSNHQHLDAGAFQIYYRGALALDSGVYEGRSGGWASAHDLNYNKRTIAHNALLVHDPAESFRFYTTPVSNDGGQRFPAHAKEARDLPELLDPANGYENATAASGWAGPDRRKPVFSHVKGDITVAYGPKVRSCTRSFVFVNHGEEGRPAALLVRDSLTTSDPSFRTAFLLHSAEEPRVEGARVDVARTDPGYSGRLRMETLWPVDPRVTAVGGPGREFEVDGRNYPNEIPANSSTDPGAWRVEVSPAVQGTQTEFLHVLQPHAADAEPFPVRTAHPDGAFLVGVHRSLTLFGDGPGPLRRTVEFTVGEDGGERTSFLATDLRGPGWTLTRRGGSGRWRQVRGQLRRGHILFAELTPGSYRLSR